MSYSIISPKNSFVDFNPPAVITCLDQPDIALPAFNDFGVQFQFQVSGDLAATAALRVVICDADGNKVLDQGILATPLCYQYRLSAQESAFPLVVNAGQPIPAGQYDYPSFLTALSELIGTTIPSSLFDFCCLFPAVTISTTTGDVTFGGFWNFGFASFPQTNMGGLFRVDDCFRYGIADADGNLLVFSNKFRRVPDTCFSTLLMYWNDDDAFGFTYPTPDYANTCRLPFTFHKPVYPITEQVYTKSDGSIRRESSRISKEYEGYTDFLTEYFHERLVVALKHDHVLFTNSDVLPQLSEVELFVEGDYKPDWTDDNTIVVAMAKFKISMPISDINSNCTTSATIPCCPPFIVSTAPTDESFTINVNFGMFTRSWNLQWRLASDAQWAAVNGLTGKSYTIPGLPPGTAIEYQLQSVCGATTGSWSQIFAGATTGSAPCDSAVSGITTLQNDFGQTTISWLVTGSATAWQVYIDNSTSPIKAGSPSIITNGLAVGNHTVKIVPICANGAVGTSATQSFVTQPLPSLVSINIGSTGSISKNTFQVGPNVQAGNRFTLQVYSHVVTVTAISGDTPATIAAKLVAAVNATSAAAWNSASSAPPGGTAGFPPTAFLQGGPTFFIELDGAHTFGSNAFLS
jgi:hypothetical protein